VNCAAKLHQDSTNFSIQQCFWHTHGAALAQIREQVFMQEQQVPAQLEWDGLDASAQHLLAVNAHGEAIGCARLMSNGSIGRMAVIKAWRSLGVGSALLKMAVALHQRQGIATITLSAQLHALDFYARAGFVICSQPYLDANILHVDMRLDLSLE
jgi:predicted GNAT family N-acyltransferase